ncbi:hypothetical protein [Paenibacillus popilliae]|uniref:Uncharacterized protein n=1 Tax=Paenibacillus popilliae TaxID=78057 RepID=A0ABY3ANR4_PAEPP|nr:hypothetical protein [Paenibacillus sp. SDF0028]TQR41144.1 hypothetical protein C7Y44_26220 [Paenibacillus sp. SDF0028]
MLSEITINLEGKNSARRTKWRWLFNIREAPASAVEGAITFWTDILSFICAQYQYLYSVVFQERYAFSLKENFDDVNDSRIERLEQTSLIEEKSRCRMEYGLN